MKHLLYLIGDELTINEKFKNYIYRTYEEKFKEINEIRIQNKTDKDLPFLLENLLNQYVRIKQIFIYNLMSISF
ncbi:hypothetical protein AEI05_05500 [Campylobacter jejuni]|nr:hypothetical protein AEI05_05500 [Campylobacter jejuni]